ncbi:glucose/sorbosone dehydrogenase domain protein [Leptospira weilii str. 2006001855]|uniref:Glucose/sorbosone dehydrogenase domain protein n=1 Tax=Leptospira weilii str. 2006001855 TaxID=996804 RepID=M6FQ57_9LEPT|nr:glucose/sorbosone dehydrogenase domain protein [Leptospira weilii str. 2006001855]
MFFTIEFALSCFIQIKSNIVQNPFSKSIVSFLRSKNVFQRIRKISIYILVSGALVLTNGCERIQNILVEVLGASDKYKAEGNTNLLQPIYSGKDETKEKISISLKEVSAGFRQPTDIQFPPGETEIFLITEQKGKLRWGKVRKNETGTLLTLNVLSVSEQGLLGLAFHPDFAKTENSISITF